MDWGDDWGIDWGEPTVLLENVKGLTVERKTIAVNQASVLQIRHEVPVDSPDALKEGQAVSFSDPDLGFQFEGKVVTVIPNFSDGEGLRYICADNYRTLVKTPAYITGQNGKQTSKLKFLEGTKMKDVLNALLNDQELPFSSLFPGGLDLSALPDPLIPTTDKGGQYLDTWIDDLLENTEGGIAFVDPNAGKPKLTFVDYYAQPDVTLDIGQFNTIVPSFGGNPLMEEANAGKTLDRKFKTIAVEGCGEFTRREDVFIPAVGISLNDPLGTTRFKFTFPEKRVTGRFLDKDGNCRDIFIMKVRFGFISGASFTHFFIDPGKFIGEELDGQMFAAIDFRTVGIISGVLPTVEAWFTYTSYDGPLTVKKDSSDQALVNEGDFWEDHPEFVKFTGNDVTKFTDVDDTSKLTPIVDGLFKRFSELPDTEGSIRVHVKGVNPNVKLGTRITNTEFDQSRVQKIDIDYQERSMILEISTLPIREFSETKKREIQERTVEPGGWFQNRSVEDQNCFCGGTIFTDSQGGGVGRSPFRDGGDAGGTSWECVQCACQELNNAKGQFKTQDDCERVCNDDGPGGWSFAGCQGCVCSEDGGQFDTLADCQAANPNPQDNCDWNCDKSNGCQAVDVGLGQFGSLAACLAICEPEGGSGDDGTNTDLGSTSPPGSPTSLTFRPVLTGPCAGSIAPQTFSVAAPSFGGGSFETPIVTLIKDIVTDSCGRVISLVKHPPFSILPKWQ